MNIAISSFCNQIVQDKAPHLPHNLFQVLKDQWIKIGLVALAALSCFVFYLVKQQYLKAKLLANQPLIPAKPNLIPTKDREQASTNVKSLTQQFESIVISKQDAKQPLIAKRPVIPIEVLKPQVEPFALPEAEVDTQPLPKPTPPLIPVLQRQFKPPFIPKINVNAQPISTPEPAPPLTSVLEQQFDSPLILEAKAEFSQNIPDISEKPKENITRPLTLTVPIPPGKVKALEDYKRNPQQCKRMSRTLSLKDIKSINSPLKNNQDVTSVVGLMQYLSDSSDIDLRHEKCIQVATDILKECDKETNGQLVEWLIKQETFNAQLLAKCLSTFLEKQEKQMPINLYALEQLIKSYQNSLSMFVLIPSNDPLMISAMSILIEHNPNENRIIALAEWFMQQPKYDKETFQKWLNIFKQKQSNHFTAVNLHYPLLNRMFAHFKEKWGEEPPLDVIKVEQIPPARLAAAPIRAPAKKIDLRQNILKKQNEAENSNQPNTNYLTIPPGKAKALKEYKSNPQQCKRMSRTLSLRDIKSIDAPFKNSQDVTSVVGLMHYFSDLSEIDLHHERCMQIAVDVLQECDKNTNGRLVEWLIQQETFNAQLLVKCLSAFLEKEERQAPIDLYAVEQLIKTYQDKAWNQKPTPSNDPIMISAMAILIKQTPNENRIIALAEWFMNQPEYDVITFSTWLRVFKQKEIDYSTRAGLYYPLLNKMLVHFKEKWGKENELNLDPDVASYLKVKISLISHQVLK